MCRDRQARCKLVLNGVSDMMCRLFIIFLFLAVAAAVSAQQTSAPSDMRVKLSFADNKTVYLMGEPIKLVMEFTADNEGRYYAEVLDDGDAARSDTVLISPDKGVQNWTEEMYGSHTYARDLFSARRLTSSPTRIELTLNDRLRFENPGFYTVTVTTRRVGPDSSRARSLVLTTNSITFELQPMSEAVEAKEVKRLSDLLDATNDWQAEEKIAKQLSYLTGDSSTREKVRRFLAPRNRESSSSAQILRGLFIARNRTLVLELIETGMRDPNVPVTSLILRAATRLRTLITYGPRSTSADGPTGMFVEPWKDPRTRKIHAAYLVELAAGLAKRTGNSQTTTATTIFTSFPKESPSADEGMSEARRIVIQKFDALQPEIQEWLVQTYWEQLRDPELVPSLKKMVHATDRGMYVRGTVLTRLLELAPGEGRGSVIEEIQNPSSALSPEILGVLKDEYLPEVDRTLVSQIRRAISESPSNGGWVSVNFKTGVLARYATKNVYGELMEMYQADGAQVTVQARGAMLAYLARHNEREALPLIEQAFVQQKEKAKEKTYAEPSLLAEVTKYYYSEEIGALLKRILETDDPSDAGQAAYLIGLHGFPADAKVLEARLQRWRYEWGNRIPLAEQQSQDQLERELVYALRHGKSWTLPPERARELKTNCLTQLCKMDDLPR